jgi:hypothetical protein
VAWWIVKSIRDAIVSARPAQPTRGVPPAPITFGAPPVNAPGQWQQPPPTMPGQWQQASMPQGTAPQGVWPAAPAPYPPAAYADPRTWPQQPAQSPVRSPLQSPAGWPPGEQPGTVPANPGKKVRRLEQRYPAIVANASQSPLTGYDSNQTITENDRIAASEQSGIEPGIETPASAATVSPLAKMLSDRNSLLSAVVLYEIMGPPRSQRASPSRR